mmetsp:Transcript_96779/g.152509  ORF Transcript_96779/g.152509 Transcript_96779/m.152509 type:complete len:226 (-) Transcript_96779:34-711(-)
MPIESAPAKASSSFRISSSASWSSLLSWRTYFSKLLLVLDSEAAAKAAALLTRASNCKKLCSNSWPGFTGFVTAFCNIMGLQVAEALKRCSGGKISSKGCSPRPSPKERSVDESTELSSTSGNSSTSSHSGFRVSGMTAVRCLKLCPSMEIAVTSTNGSDLDLSMILSYLGRLVALLTWIRQAPFKREPSGYARQLTAYVKVCFPGVISDSCFGISKSTVVSGTS